jgi:TAT (twin-arginine translocation) pathway signal sequence
MRHRDVSRRTLLKGGGATLAGLSLPVADAAHAFSRDDDREKQAWHDDQPDPSQSLGQPGDVVLPWLDQPPPFPAPDFAGHQLVWEELD